MLKSFVLIYFTCICVKTTDGQFGGNFREHLNAHLNALFDRPESVLPNPSFLSKLLMGTYGFNIYPNTGYERSYEGPEPLFPEAPILSNLLMSRLGASLFSTPQHSQGKTYGFK